MTAPRWARPLRTHADRIDTVATLTAAVLAGVAIVAAVAGAALVAAVAAAATIIAGAAAAVLHRRIVDRRLDRITRETATLRLATADLARDQDTTAKMLTRLARGTDRAIAAAFGRMIGDGTREIAFDVDPAVLAAVLTLSDGRPVHFVGSPDRWRAYVVALAELSPTTMLGLVPRDEPGGYLDQIAARRRAGGPTAAVFVADDAESLIEVVDGPLAELIARVLGTPDYLVLAAPDLHGRVARAPSPGRRVTPCGAVVLLVSRHEPPAD